MLLDRLIRQVLEFIGRCAEPITPRRISRHFGEDSGGERVLLSVRELGYCAQGFFEELGHVSEYSQRACALLSTVSHGEHDS